jgi:hypothetical protein
LLFRVVTAFFAEAEREAADLDAAALPTNFPPLRDGAVSSGWPRPLLLRLPPPASLFTVAQARLSASPSETPRCSTLLDMFGLSFLLIGVSGFVATWH